MDISRTYTSMLTKVERNGIGFAVLNVSSPAYVDRIGA